MPPRFPQQPFGVFTQQTQHTSGVGPAPYGPVGPPNGVPPSSLHVDLNKFDNDVIKVSGNKPLTLGDDNFREWDQSFRRFCRMKRIWGIVDGSLPLPFGDNARAVWQVYADFLVVTVLSHATRSQRAYISTSDNVTPKDVYDTWSAIHSIKSKGRLIPLLTRLLTKKAETGESVDKLAADMRRMNEQVALINRMQGSMICSSLSLP